MSMYELCGLSLVCWMCVCVCECVYVFLYVCVCVFGVNGVCHCARVV